MATKTKQIGIWTSARDQVAIDLVLGVHRAVKTRRIPRTKIAYVLVDCDPGETAWGDKMIANVNEAKLPLITFSSARFEPEFRKRAIALAKGDKKDPIKEWRFRHDGEVLSRLPPASFDVLLGYMRILGERATSARDLLNLHPAAPNGPVGTYAEVIWQLIAECAKETGVQIQRVIEELDKGPTVAHTRIPIVGPEFYPHWEELYRRIQKSGEKLEEIAKKEGNENPLFAAIRAAGVRSELPLVIATLAALGEGHVRIENGKVLNADNEVLSEGLDLTAEIRV